MRSIFLRIFLWFWLTMVLIALSLAFFWNLESESSSRPESLTASAVNMYAVSVAETFDSRGPQAANALLDKLQLNAHIRAELLDVNLQVLVGSPGSLDLPLLSRAKTSTQPQIQLSGDVADAATAVRTQSGKNYIFAAEIPHRAGGLFHGSASQLLPRWGIAILISGLICYILTRYLTQPVLRLRSAASVVAAGDFSVRITSGLAERRDEMGELVRDFNEMAAQIERLMETQQQLLRDISHELRSPLARLNVALELARKSAGRESMSALDRIEHESERLNEMIGRLLTLAKIKTLIDPPEQTTVSLRPLLDQIAHDASFEAAAKNCRVEVSGASACELHGSPELLHSAIENIVRNAVRYAPPDSAIRIGLSCQSEACRISVTDEGPGVPQPELDRIFLPFYRLSNSREHKSGGTGIGLAITQEVARLHGGTVKASNAQPHGLVVEMNLPRH